MDLSKDLIMFFVDVYQPFNLVRNGSSKNQARLRAGDPNVFDSVVSLVSSELGLFILKVMRPLEFSTVLGLSINTGLYFSAFWLHKHCPVIFEYIYFNDHFFAQYVHSHFHLNIYAYHFLSSCLSNN